MNFLNNFQIDILLAERVVLMNQWDSCSPSRDPFNRFYYVVQGNAEVLLKNKPVLLKEGNGYILPAGVLLQLLPTKENFEQVYVHFNATLPGGIELFSFLECPHEVSGDHLKKFLPDSWMDCFSHTDKDDYLGNLNREAILRLLLNPFIAEGIKKTPEKQTEIERFEKIIAYIDRHYSEQIKIKKLADMAFLQPTYFSNIFAKHFGIAPQRYICQVRINKAQHMLEHGNLPIKEISGLVGYDDELYFSRLFKNYVGIPPTVYRRQRKLNPY
jgi:AraC-like DNA-binding protein